MVALVAGSFVAFAALVDGPRARRGPWIVYLVLTALSVYASYVAVFALPAQLVALAAGRRPAWRRALSAMAACVVCWIPLAVLALSRGSGQLFWIGRPHFKLVRQVAGALTSAGFEPNFHPVAVATPLAIVTVVLVLIALVRVVQGREWGAVLALSWLVVPIGLMLVWSFIGQPIFTPRNLLVSLPAVALLLAWVLLRSPLPPVAAWSLVALLIALRAVVLVPSYGTSPENWRAATAYVLHASRPGDCVAFYPLDGSMPFDYYAGRPVAPHVEQYVTPRVAPGCSRVWLVASHQGLPSGTATSRAHYASYLAVRDALATRFPDHVTRSFGYASVIWVELFSR
jgi:hypothetical protein